ncbi:MAG: glycosyl hydrolase [Thermomicrobiales bacterium]
MSSQEPRAALGNRGRARTRRAILRGLLGGLGVGALNRLSQGSDVALAQRGTTTDGGQVAIGAYLPDVLYKPDILVRYAAAIRRKPDFLVWYAAWDDGAFGDEQRKILRTLDSWGTVPVIAWDPMDHVGPPVDQPKYKLSNIIRGDFDTLIESWAKGLAAFGSPVILNFAHEMNGNWTPWGVGVNGNQPGEFITAWRHVHDIFSRVGTPNVRWMWTPNELYERVPASLEAVYPGDEYVDWFGMNGFNWGAAIRWKNCDCQSAWRTFGEVFDNTYRHLVALGDKPIMIGEVGSAEKGGSKADWITDALTVQLPEHYPRIRAVAWFNKIATGLDTVEPGVVEPTTASVDWRVDSSMPSLEAYATAVAAPYYQGSLHSILAGEAA